MCLTTNEGHARPPTVPPSAAQEEPDEEEDGKGRSWAHRSLARAHGGQRSSAHPPTCPPAAAQEHRGSAPWERVRQTAPWCASEPAPVAPTALPGWQAASRWVFVVQTGEHRLGRRRFPELGRVLRLALLLPDPGLPVLVRSATTWRGPQQSTTTHIATMSAVVAVCYGEQLRSWAAR